jgi:hypothetical protein
VSSAAVAALICTSWPKLQASPRVIEITADHDSRYRIPGQSRPVITAFAGEELLLRITANRGTTQNRDGSVHGFTLLRAKDRSRVPGWDFLLKPGVQEFAVRVPIAPGEYQVVCTVICSQDHEGMHMKFIVLQSGDAPRAAKADTDLSVVAGETRTFIGEIADTQCALNVHSLSHSHQEMIKAKRMGPDAASCARYCVRNMGGSFVLLHDNKTIYRLDDQVRAAAYAGHKVLVQGLLEQGSNTIQVSSIKSAD